MSHAFPQKTPPNKPASPTDAVAVPSRIDYKSESSATQFPTPYFWFLAGTGTWFMAMGMQGVLFSWLVVGVLRAEAQWVGITQSTMMLPSVVLTLLGGAIADRYDNRLLLVILHVSAGLLSFGLLTIVATGHLSMASLLIYAACMGTVQAFVMPARDAQLSQVAGRNMLRSVTGMTMTQWSMQVLGSLAAASARWFGTIPTLGVQSLMLFAGVWPSRRMPQSRDRSSSPPLRLSDVTEGVREVIRSSTLLPTLLLAITVGVFFIGPFVVVLPLLVRDFYNGGVDQLALLNMAFPIGTIIGSLAILWFGGIRRRGRAQVVALLLGAACLFLLSRGLPFGAALVAVTGWGITAAVFINAGRTIYQEQASEENRARVLSVYTIGFMGAAGVLGAPLSGFLVAQIGPLDTCVFASVAMAVAVGCVFSFTTIRQVR